MTTKNPIHIKVEYLEAVESKKDILVLEVHLLKIMAFIKNYTELRKRETRTKLKLYRKFIALSKEITRLQKKIPSEEIESKVAEIHKRTKPEKITLHANTSIEEEIRKIRSRIDILESNNF